MMAQAAFLILWIYLAMFAVLAGGDFGVGIWVLVTSGRRSDRGLGGFAMSYFSPVWEVHGLFLIFFLTGLLVAFPADAGALGRSLIPLVIVALAGLVLRSAAYVALAHGPRTWGPWSVKGFGAASLVCAASFGLAGAAPASGDLVRGSLTSSYYTSAVGLTVVPLAIAACAHLGAIGIWNHALHRDPPVAAWYRKAVVMTGTAAILAGAAFTAAIADDAPGTRHHLVSAGGAVLLAGGAAVAGGVLLAILGRARAALLLTLGGYIVGLVGGAFIQLPYLIYPTLTLHAAASPRPVLEDFLGTAIVGAPLVIVAVAALHLLSVRPSASEIALRPSAVTDGVRDAPPG
jgi:cytochrome d ubiquinol oxidase subunit II